MVPRSSLQRSGASDSQPIKPASRSPTIVFQYQKRNLLVPRPTSYPAAVALARKYTQQPLGEIRFLGRVALLDEDVEITPDAWALVINDMPPLRIEVGETCDSDSEEEPSQKRVKLRSDDEMTVFVRCMRGNTLTFTVQPTQTILSLKEKIQPVEKLLVREQRLLLDGRQLEDDRTFTDYNVQKESILFLVKRLLGGKPVIYFYPPASIDVQVRLTLVPQWRFSAVYPLSIITDTKPSPGALPNQEIEWSILARPNGLLTDKQTGSDIAYLFWEAETCDHLPISPPHSRSATPSGDHQDSSHLEFIPGSSRCSPQNAVLFEVEDVPAYLDQALLALGLHVEARTSFITYWLPNILKHEFIALRFIHQESYERAALLSITPTPDVVSRVFMLFQGIKEEDAEGWSEALKRGREDPSMWRSVVGIDSAKQEDTTLFRVLEWGGMEFA